MGNSAKKLGRDATFQFPSKPTAEDLAQIRGILQQNSDTIAALKSQVRDLVGERERLNRAICDWESREAAVVPEDQRFEEVIVGLRDNVESLERSVPKWIDCGERLPSDGEAVLLVVQDTKTFWEAGTFFEGVWTLERTDPCDDSIEFKHSDGQVTHWMPQSAIPLPGKQEKA